MMRAPSLESSLTKVDLGTVPSSLMRVASAMSQSPWRTKSLTWGRADAFGVVAVFVAIVERWRGV
jgi:hypothetical protein